MRDVKPLLHSPHAAIFYKELEQDLVDIEFYTSEVCLVYIKTGQEVITTCDNKTFTLGLNEAIFLPKGLNLHSDYINSGDPLNAYLLFFSDDIVTDFLATGANISPSSTEEATIFKINQHPLITLFFQSLQATYLSLHNSPHLLKLKLLEILHLIDINDHEKQLRSRLSLQQQASKQQENPKRNIKRLMKKYIISNLNVKDFAALSGRSVSSFNREFKQLYGTTAKQWIVQKRLTHARMLLVDKRLSVTETANEVGYENVSHFITAFKKMYNQTPHQIKTES
ncbi:family transcriptional regulator [Leptolyngbya sp. Heron Island J]|nr:family transcriptional regulator [Leptolyngbya sp. Heron Island J]